MFSTLAALKNFVLPEELREDDEFDNTLITIGQGVAKRFDTETDRKLLRAVADSAIFSGDRMVYVLPRYPVEEITGVAYRADYGSDWAADAEYLIEQLANRSGLLTLDRAGSERSQVRISWTGGYWVDLTGTDTMPEGATPMPHDLYLAWLSQVKQVFDTRDKFGSSFADAARGMGGAFVGFTELDLLPSVERTLKQYKRHQII